MGHNSRGHNHHSHIDDSEVFKRNTISLQRRRKILAKISFTALTIIAVAIVAVCVIVSL